MLVVERRTLEVVDVVVRDDDAQPVVVTHLLGQRERRQRHELEVVDEVDALAAADREPQAERVALRLGISQLDELGVGPLGQGDDLIEDELIGLEGRCHQL